MTLKRDPVSAGAAWKKTGERLGWEKVGDLCKTTANTARNWCDEKGDRYPPLWAIEAADVALKQANASPFNTIALGRRIGARSRDPVKRLEELAHELEHLVDELLAAGEVNAAEAGDASVDIIRFASDLLRHLCAEDDVQHEEERPHLRQVTP